MAEHLELRNVEENILVMAHLDQAIGAQLGKRSIEVGRAETERVAHHLLR
jgi:hypothetical protein